MERTNTMHKLRAVMRPIVGNCKTVFYNEQKICYLPKSVVPFGCGMPQNMDFHSGPAVCAWSRHKVPTKWLTYNKKIFPPQAPDEERRPAFVCHMKTNIKYSPWKMWYIASMVRGLSVDEAVKQLSFIFKKGAPIVKETILEAQELAVSKHNVEFKTNLWVAESLVGKGEVIKGMRRHARGRMGLVEYFHCHYFVRLEEGTPPEHYYYHKRPLSGPEMLENWMTKMRRRKITGSL